MHKYLSGNILKINPDYANPALRSFIAHIPPFVQREYLNPLDADGAEGRG